MADAEEATPPRVAEEAALAAEPRVAVVAEARESFEEAERADEAATRVFWLPKVRSTCETREEEVLEAVLEVAAAVSREPAVRAAATALRVG